MGVSGFFCLCAVVFISILILVLGLVVVCLYSLLVCFVILLCSGKWVLDLWHRWSIRLSVVFGFCVFIYFGSGEMVFGVVLYMFWLF